MFWYFCLFSVQSYSKTFNPFWPKPNVLPLIFHWWLHEMKHTKKNQEWSKLNFIKFDLTLKKAQSNLKHFRNVLVLISDGVPWHCHCALWHYFHHRDPHPLSSAEPTLPYFFSPESQPTTKKGLFQTYNLRKKLN